MDETFDRLAAHFTASWTESGINGLIDGYGETESGQMVTAMRIEYATFSTDGV